VRLWSESPRQGHPASATGRIAAREISYRLGELNETGGIKDFFIIVNGLVTIVAKGLKFPQNPLKPHPSAVLY
jgi:hypothetical protein